MEHVVLEAPLSGQGQLETVRYISSYMPISALMPLGGLKGIRTNYLQISYPNVFTLHV